MRFQTWFNARSFGFGEQTQSASILFSVRICYMSLISKCRRESDLGLCMMSGLAKSMPLHSGKFQWNLRPNTFLNQKSPLRSRTLVASPKVMHRLRSDCPLHFNIDWEYIANSHGEKTKMLALVVCFPQPCPNAGRRFVPSRSHLNYYRSFFSYPHNRIRWNAL